MTLYVHMFKKWSNIGYDPVQMIYYVFKVLKALSKLDTDDY